MEEQGRWERFRRTVMASPDLRRELLEPIEREKCIAGMLGVSRRCGLPLTQNDIESAEQPFRSGPVPVVGLAEAAAVLTGWIPRAVTQAGGELLIDWFDPGDRRLTEPFFEDSIAVARRLPFYRWFSLRTPFEALLPLATQEPGVAPAGFVFHMSRCGSTLVAQMLAALERHVVLSEPEPLDWALRGHLAQPDLTEQQEALWLKAMLSALGRRHATAADRLFVKFDCWHTPLLPRIHRVFPEVPWAFLYRDPIEVLVSHMREPGRQMAEQSGFSGLFGIEAGATLPMEEYREHVLASICGAALECHRQSPGLFLNYTDLPDAVFLTLAAHFRVRFSAEEEAQMRTVTGAHSKRPYFAFESDSAGKQAAGQTTVSEACRVRLKALSRECEEAGAAASKEDR